MDERGPGCGGVLSPRLQGISEKAGQIQPEDAQTRLRSHACGLVEIWVIQEANKGRTLRVCHKPNATKINLNHCPSVIPQPRAGLTRHNSTIKRASPDRTK